MRLMVIGASGYLGNTLYKKLRDYNRDEVYGTCFKSNKHELLKINLLDRSDIKKMLSYKPDIIIWTVYDKEEEMSLAVNGLNRIINSISEEVRLIYVSTTIGSGEEQTEDIIPQKRMPGQYLWKYINGKIQGENIVRKHSNHIIVRPGSIYGYDCDGNMDNRMEELLSISKSGKIYSRTANMYASFVHVLDLADAIVELIYTDFRGVINISGETPVSHYDFNKHLAQLLKISKDFIIPDYKPEAIYHNLNNSKRKELISTLIRNIV